ncbi:alpha/beta fold hydrolase [Microbacterium sp. SA39]|uniref:alpha/beta fold hydrolase n=1 Tax=Microbacterium sp. SA39 TaxID=1263625 RepID=UPI00061DF8B3|nr:alpha/beta hydrolase [Microbacterium sp. SA39]KJQ54322.1 putative non-heme bromoperoxidase BpoC [Microbacterium sp. SA39]
MSPLVLLAGMNCTADLWADAGTDGAVQPVLDRPTIPLQVSGLLASLPERFVLVGHSLGAIVAMSLALAAPERVAGLCLVSTNAKAPTDAQRAGWREWLSRLDAGEDARELQRSILPALLGASAMRDRPDLVERTLAMGTETGDERLRAQLELQLDRGDLLGRLPSLATPTLVVSGLDDVITPPHFHTEIVTRMPDARLVTLDAGHLLPLERPEAFGSLLRSWQTQLADAEAGAARR